jgi:hypothetical protein
MPSQRREEEETPRRDNKSEEGDATPDLLLKHPDTILATYI